MEKVTINNKEYLKSESGFFFSPKTDIKILETIEKAWNGRYRVKIKYKDGYEDFTGYTKDGLNVTMLIGRSTGSIKIPLHIPSKISSGGVALLTEAIEKISIIY